MAAGYTDLAEELQDVEDGREAMERVVAFEAEHDAQACFPDRRTVSGVTASPDERATRLRA